MSLPTIWAVEREASDAVAYPLALVENIQRVDLSHAEKVAALDQLGELAQGGGLQRTARSLHMSPGWLSVQLCCAKIRSSIRLSRLDGPYSIRRFANERE